MSKPVILTGLRANNDLHLGNYLGALLPLVDMAKSRAGEYQINLFVPDLHSFTTPIDHAGLQAAIMQNLRVFVAAGLPLDHNDVFIYRQSYVPAHSELTWILDCFTGMGEMERMTQYKDKSNHIYKENAHYYNQQLSSERNYEQMKAKQSEVLEVIGPRVSVGLFNYPVLMAADILLYGAEYVPVGDDQTQHLEFTRDIAERLNKRFGELFVIPKPVKQQHEFFGKDQGLRIRDLQNPAKKMSKSDTSGKGIIFLTDSVEQARQKVMGAETDSLGEIQYDYDERPGVSNLLDILELLGGQPEAFIGQSQYGPLKGAVADKISDFLTDFQAKLANVDGDAITRKLEANEAVIREVASQRLHQVQQAIGLRP
jgi:tryptophanyl-tRNA synthetase